ncbi:hypothetical protein [Streptomyces anulatus]|uniref:hypothetical protein n=1 Tax=Streptomyces anulatus TaxID=1892 RepID=UPI002E101D10|nr:hypothetical protein OG557_39190 [Streptomyces anulatus]
MKRNAKDPFGPSTRLDRWRTATVTHLRKWAAGPGQRVQTSFMCGVAYKVGEFGTALVLAWLISRY